MGYAHHDHVCWAYTDRMAWRKGLGAYLLEGAARRDRLLYVFDSTRTRMVDDLAELRGRDRLVATGQLSTLDYSAWRASAEHDGAEVDGTSIRRHLADAVQAGFRGLRVAVDCSTTAVAASAPRQETAFELVLDAAAAELPLTLLCGYDADRFMPHQIEAVAFVHPLRRGVKSELDAALFAEELGRWRLQGSVDLGTLELLRHGLGSLEAQRGDVEVELGSLEFIDVGSTRALVDLAAALAPQRRLVLHDSPAVLTRILALCWEQTPGLSQVRG